MKNTNEINNDNRIVINNYDHIILNTNITV
jgi:hypothetical protein